METPYKCMYGKGENLRMFRAIGARAFVHVETYTQKPAAKAWEGKLCRCSTDSRACRVYNRTTKSVTESRNLPYIETPRHSITNLVDDFYLQNVHDYVSSLNSPTTNTDTTDSHAKRNDLLHRLTELSSDGGISTSSNRDPEPAGSGEPSRPSTRNRTASSTANQVTVANRMSTRATSGGDVAPVDTGAFNDRQLNEVRRLGLFANTASPDYLH